MKRFLIAGSGLLACLLLLAGCKHSDPMADQHAANATETAWGLAYLTGYLFNHYVAVRQAGPQDLTVYCNAGGYVTIKGWTGYDRQSAIGTMDLTYEFFDANLSVITSNLTVSFHPLNGAIRITGAARSLGEPCENTVASSTGLVYDITVDPVSSAPVDLSGNGPYGAHTWTATNESWQVYRNIAGQLDSIYFSWNYCVSPACGGSTNTYDIRVEL